jgi:Metallo-beta-lactamase superfamily
MRLEVFHAADGDCLLLSSGDGHHVLVDGGRAGTFADNTQPRLQELKLAGEAIDLVLVSHVDADHITGILRLLRDVGDWEVFDHQRTAGANPTFPEPTVPRPPDIKALWHNSWRAQVDELEGPIAALALQVTEATALNPELVTSAPESTQLALTELSGLAESIADGVQLSRLIEERTPLQRNKGFPDHLALLRDRPHRRRVGRTTLTVIGPTERHLIALRDEWRKWFEEKGVRLAQGGTGAQGTEAGGAGDRAGASLALGGRAPASIEEAAQIIEQAGSEHVTPPNRASITVLAEERGRTVLLTGDAAEEELIDGLTAIGKLGANEDGAPFHCTVLKVQHHGASHNLSRGFAERVVADHYVFSGDGAHGNPEPSVIATITETRPRDAGPYTLWFSSSEHRSSSASRRASMAAALDEARDAATRHPNLTVRVLADGDGSLVIDV